MKRSKITVERLKKDFEYRSFLMSTISLLITVAFLAYNLLLGVWYGSVWNYSIGIYYFMLVIIRSWILFSERSWQRIPQNLLSAKRKKLFTAECILLLILDALMIVPIALLVLSRRSVNLTVIPAITVAAYTTYKVTVAILNYKKASKSENLTLKGLKMLNLTEAVVAVMTLQNTLITVFGEGDSMIMLTSYTSAGLLLFMVVIPIVGLKIKKNN